jgi:hypothetical protein
MRAKPGALRLVSGTPRVYTKTAESGRKREQAFCGNCGSPIYATSPGPEPRIYIIRAGTIDQRAELRPSVQIWSRSQLPWLDALATLPRMEREP